MALIVEDGTGKIDAESYNSVAEVSSILAAYGEETAFDALGATIQEQVARKATRYMDSEYLFRGRKGSSGQALEWPRVGAYDDDGYLYDDDSLPARLKTVHALLCAEGNVDLQPSVTEPGDVSSESVKVGPISISTSYTGGKSAATYRAKVEAMIAELVEDAGVIRRA